MCAHPNKFGITSDLHYLCNMKRGVVLILTLWFLWSSGVKAQIAAPSDSIRIGLITCGPGEEIYNLFGHSAIHFQNLTKGIDVVFNYGVFSFKEPNFIFRFTLGQTDYQLAANDYQEFVDNYAWNNRWVSEQELNLFPAEKIKTAQLLEENYLPQNRIYRYNFFYDNCSTRPRDIIEKALDNHLTYADDLQLSDGESFRSIIKQYTKGHSWNQFGIDFLLGPKADEPISRRLSMFIPFYLQHYFAQAQIQDNDGSNRALVSSEQQLVAPISHEGIVWTEVFSPLRTTLLLFIIVALLTIHGLKRQKSLWMLDAFLFAAAGIAGCLLSYMALLSEHPAVSPNYLIIALLPTHLLLLPWFISKVKKHQLSRYLVLTVVILTLFIILWPIIPQKFNFAVLPLALILLIRSISNIVLSYQNKK